MENNNLNDYISRWNIKMVEKFNEELIAFANETDKDIPALYDEGTTFTLFNVRLENGCLIYEYNGKEEVENMIRIDSMTGKMYEYEGIWGGIVERISFWRRCLRLAKIIHGGYGEKRGNYIYENIVTTGD